MGSYTAPLLRTVGRRTLPIYPGKGYSATFKILKPGAWLPPVSFIDDSVKCAMSRLGDQLRIAGTIEVGGYDTRLDTSLARARCAHAGTPRRNRVPRRVRHPFGQSRAAIHVSGPVCARPHPPTFRTSASPPSASCGSMRAWHAGLDPWRGLGQGAGRVAVRPEAPDELPVLRLLAR